MTNLSFSASRNVIAFSLFFCVGLMALGTHADAARKKTPMPPALPAPMEGYLDFSYQGVNRKVFAYVPQNLPANGPVPVLIALHGGGGDAAAMREKSQKRFERLADRDKVIILYPEGTADPANETAGKHWNDGRDYYPELANVDDVGFLSALITEMVNNYSGIDRANIYLTGFSNGSMMALRTACRLPDQIAGVAAVVGALATNIQGECRTFSRPMPTIMMFGTEDHLMPWDGTQVLDPRGKPLGDRLTVPATKNLWASINGCLPNPKKITRPNTVRTDGSTVTVDEYTCQDHEVAKRVFNFYTIQNGGHTWPGGVTGKADKVAGNVNMDIVACDEIWSFFSAITLAK